MTQPVPSAQPPIPISYTSRDFAAFVSDLQRAATVLFPEWTATDPNDFGNVLIELWAYLGDNLSWYSDRIANEAFLSTATQYNSVALLANMLDYSPKGTSAAQVVLTITVPETALVEIPALTQVTTNPTDGTPAIVFEVDNSFTRLPSGSTASTLVTATLTATQGTTVNGELVGTSDGSANQTFTLLQTPVIDGSLYLSVQVAPVGDPQLWAQVDRIIEAAPNANAYVTSVNANGAMSVTFGDGVTGAIPPTGAVIYATYRIGGGPQGNVGAGTINTFPNVTPIVAASGNTLSAATLLVTNLLPANGGANAESISSIVAHAPASFAAQSRAVTLADYASLAFQVPRVAKASAAALVYTNVVVYIAPFGAGQPTQDLISATAAYFTGKTLPGVSVTVATPVYQPIDVSVIVQANAPYSRSTVQTNVLTALQSLLSFDNVDFGQRVTISQVYDTVQAAPGVAYATIGVLDVAGGVNAADVVLPVNTIPTVGTLEVSVLGGIDTTVPVGTLGSLPGPTQPGIPGTPALEVMRCDPSSSHFEVLFTEATNADHYNVVLTYFSVGNIYPDNIVKQATYGPFTTGYAIIDAALVGNASLTPAEQAVTVQFTVQAFNGTAGPISSGALTLPYQCEQPQSAAASVSPPSQPQITNFVASSFDSSGNPIYTFNAAWTAPTTSTATQLVIESLDGSGNVVASTSSPLGSASTLANYSITVPKDVVVSIRFYVTAYNGSIGPIAGPATSITITVPVIGGGTSPYTYTGTPTLASAAAASGSARTPLGGYTANANVQVANTQNIGYTTGYYDATGALIAGTQSALQYQSVASPSASTVTVEVTATLPPPPSGSAPVTVHVTYFAANPNGVSTSTTLTFTY